MHHTQLLNRLVRDKKLVPVAPVAQDVTYHDPCFLGRHNQVYTPPRELVGATGAEYVEMERSNERSFCCGAGGARMWMEETLGSRINVNRTDEAISTGAEKIAVGCPFCRVMLSDGLTARQSEDESLLNVEVLDVAQLLLESVKRGQPDPVAEQAEEPAAEEPAAEVPAAESILDEAAVEPAADASAPHAEPHPESGDSTEPDAEAVVYDESTPEIPAEKHVEQTPEQEELFSLEQDDK